MSNHKLYLILESCDSGGYNILAVRSTVDECVQWLDADPERISNAVVSRVEAGADPIDFNVLPETFRVLTLNKETRAYKVVTSVMDYAGALHWMKEEAKKHGAHIIQESFAKTYIHLWVADTEEQLKVNGKFTHYHVEARSCRISEEPIK